MPIEIIRLLAFEGPNVRGPQPGVLLELRAGRDRSKRLRAALKDAAQSVGVVIGYLDVGGAPEGEGFVIRASFTTPTPAIGAAVAGYVVDGLNARDAGDEEWDAEGPLWDLQKRRRAEATPLVALQLAAEAAARGVPAFVRADGALQLGYGARGWALEAAALRPGTTSILAAGDVGVGPPPLARPAEALAVPWERLGPVPIIAVAGGAGRAAAVRLVADELRARGLRVASSADAGFDATRALLADPAAESVVVGLEPGDLLRRGLAFEVCARSAVLGLPEQLPPEAAGPAELARALGIPMLVTDPGGLAVLGADTPEVAALAEYAPCRVALARAPGGDADALGELAARAILGQAEL